MARGAARAAHEAGALRDYGRIRAMTESEEIGQRKTKAISKPLFGPGDGKL